MDIPLSIRTANSADSQDLTHLVNGAYRGETGSRGWTTETHLLGGQRTDAEMIRELIDRPQSLILVAAELNQPARPIGCVHIEARSDGEAYLGMLTVDVDYQKRGVGEALLSRAEIEARGKLGARRMRMTVIDLRHELIAWYERRGYRATGERERFPYGNPRFGIPLRDDLEFIVLARELGQ